MRAAIIRIRIISGVQNTLRLLSLGRRMRRMRAISAASTFEGVISSTTRAAVPPPYIIMGNITGVRSVVLASEETSEKTFQPGMRRNHTSPELDGL